MKESDMSRPEFQRFEGQEIGPREMSNDVDTGYE